MTFPKFTWSRRTAGRKKDPINIIFSNTTLEKVLTYFDNNGWYFRNKWVDLAFDQYLPDNPPRDVQNDQRLQGDLWERYHIRIWKSENKLVAATHFEGIGLAFGHNVYNFEAAEDKVAEQFSNYSTWLVEKDKIDLENRVVKKYNNGFATEITERRTDGNR